MTNAFDQTLPTMDKYLKPSRFGCDPNAAGADKQFKHWLKTFQNFVSTIKFDAQTTAPSTTPGDDANETTTTNTGQPTVDQLKLTTLMNYVESNVFEYIEDCDTYDAAVTALKNIYVKPVNEIYARYQLATCQQSEGESLDTFIQNLHRLSKQCNFKEVTAEQHRQGYVRDAFISGIRSREIRQKLLENEELTMEQVFSQARTLHVAHTNAAQYSAPTNFTSCATSNTFVSNGLELSGSTVHDSGLENVSAATNVENPCPWCGYSRHQRRQQCPAWKHKCKLCGKQNHWERVCKSNQQQNGQQPANPRGQVVAAMQHQPQYQPQQHQLQQHYPPPPPNQQHTWPTLATTFIETKQVHDKPQQSEPSQPQSDIQQHSSVHHDTSMPKQQQQQCQQQQPQCQQQHQKSLAEPSLAALSSKTQSNGFCPIKLKKEIIQALIDSGSLSSSFIDKKLANRLNIPISPCKIGEEVTLADGSSKSKIEGECYVDFLMQKRSYKGVKLHVMDNLCVDVILGQDFMKQHDRVIFEFGGSQPPLHISAVTAMNVPPPSLFEHLSEDCKPVAVKSRKQTNVNSKFIKEEVQKLLKEGIIKPSTSPWRAQVLVTKDDDTHKKRMVIDYKQTINRFTELDAYPIPDVEKMVRDISEYSWFSTFDLKSAYHQVPMREDEQKYTAFEADGGLWEFTRVPFGLTNGVSKFQRTVDNLTEREQLQATFPFMDNVTVCGRTLEELKENEARFREMCRKYNLTLNEDKSVTNVQVLPILGYLVSHGEIKPDPERLLPLRNLAPPVDLVSQRRVVGMFAYYSRWIPRYSEKIRPLSTNETFPLQAESLNAFQSLREEIAAATLITPVEGVQLEVETDASDYAIAATLNQLGRPVAFFSRTLNKSEHHQPPVEKEACAIVEAVQKWRHYLQGRHFKLTTDQRSVAFMYDQKRPGTKIKNDKIMRWCTELSPYSFDIVYRPGPENKAADALSRHVCSALLCSTNVLKELHDALCHPGITRLNHYAKTKNIPCSVEDIRNITSSCQTCLKLKPNFHKSSGNLIKATQPFERINIDFKGPLPTVSCNKYILTIVDEFSRFPFAFPCRDMTSETVIKCLIQLFSLFGMPGFVHSDRGPSLISEELRTFLNSRGIATSRTSSYNPRGNGQVERYNGIIWSTVSLALESRGLAQCHWEQVLSDALHSIRSLLCTATNATPHERLFGYQRRSASGHSVPSWLSSADRAYLRKHVRQSKFDPLVEEVEILHANPQYVHVRLPSGVESTVSIRDVAPVSGTGTNDSLIDNEAAQPAQIEEPVTPYVIPQRRLHQDPETAQCDLGAGDQPISTNTEPVTPAPPLQMRKSTRTSKPVVRLIEEM